MANFGCYALWLLGAITYVNAFFLMGVGTGVYERLDPIVNPNGIASHAHIVAGGGNFGSVLTTDILRKSKCTSTPISEDKSSYWTDTMYFQWKNGSFTSLEGGFVVYYLYPSNVPKGTVTAFPDNFRMISGTPTLRTYNASSFAQQAITFLCLDFNGVSTRHNELPVGVKCPSGIRAQVNFPSCWDGLNVDSTDHKSHVAFPSGGPDSGSCTDPKHPKTLPRIFMELYWATGNFDYSQAMNPQQPFVLSQGDATGYGHHADYFNGWDAGVLQRVVDECSCPEFGDPTCCAQQGIFTYNPKGNQCPITPTVDEQVLGTLDKLPGNNPVTGLGAVVPAPAPAPPASSSAAPAKATPTAPDLSTSSTVKLPTPPAAMPPIPSSVNPPPVLSTALPSPPSSSPADGHNNSMATPSSNKPVPVVPLPSPPPPPAVSSAADQSNSPTANSKNPAPASTGSALAAQSTDGGDDDDEDCEDEDESSATGSLTLDPPAASPTEPSAPASAKPSAIDSPEPPALVPAPPAASPPKVTVPDSPEPPADPVAIQSIDHNNTPPTTSTILATTPPTTTQPAAPLVTTTKNGQRCIVRPGTLPPTMKRTARNVSPPAWNVGRSAFMSHKRTRRHFQKMFDGHL